MTIAVGIFGASGYTGGELVRLLARHPKARIAFVTSERHAGRPLAEVFPHLGALPDLVCRPLTDFKSSTDCDVAFCALPHLTSMDAVPELLQRGTRVVDLSADFRLRDEDIFHTWYGEAHRAPQLLPEAVYGLPEVTGREAIQHARLIANPGCYPTSILLALAPLFKEKAIETESVILDSKSGVSGAGRSAKQDSLYAEVAEGFRAYKTIGHRHTPEIEQELGRVAGTTLKVRFSPHLIPQSRGILSTCYVRPRLPLTQLEWRDLLATHYQDEPFVEVLPVGQHPTTLQVRGSNHCVLGVALDERTGWLVVMSVIDNLVKGASGQAVQNMNLMMGVEETAGLEQLPLYP
ncbi:MAG: N-acetyl-gamma-glutamyl-phosphate reductase [Magnetococcales bacterium]|nr:N-acetyl-gamma-glutamyl-phosphate reductase [Magnetococcales bacterium]MBF0262636.1 N-acetyl-gamma-glutamyl-phosphate reductase [Magnetococcales bacterium]